MNTILQFYRYTFYWGYAWSLRNYGQQNAPEITGLGSTSLLLFLNAFALLLASDWVLHAHLSLPTLPWYVLWPAAFLLLSPHYWYFIRSGRYRAIAAEFDAWDADRRWYMNRRVIFYSLGSILTLCLAAYLGRNHPNPLHLPW